MRMGLRLGGGRGMRIRMIVSNLERLRRCVVCLGLT